MSCGGLCACGCQPICRPQAVPGPPLLCLFAFFFRINSQFSKFLRQMLLFGDFFLNLSMFRAKFQDLVINQTQSQKNRTFLCS